MKICQWVKLAIALAGVAALGSRASADVYMPNGRSHSSVQVIKSADDAVASIPFLSKLSRSFLIGDGFKVKMTGMELRIDHMGTHSTSGGSRRNCMVGFSYATPVAFFGSRIDVPLFHSETLQWADWGMNTPGD